MDFVDKTGKFYEWFARRGGEALADQARRQLLAAQSVPVEWAFSEQKALDATRALFQSKGISGITLTLR